MLKTYLKIISIAAIFLFTFTIAYAQDEEAETTTKKMTQQEDMQKYMKIIASNSTMRMEMMNLMIQNCEGDKNALKEIGQTMINNPEMHIMIKGMMNENESIKVRSKTDGKSKEHMIMESAKSVKKPKYDKIHK